MTRPFTRLRSLGVPADSGILVLTLRVGRTIGRSAVHNAFTLLLNRAAEWP